MAEECWIKLSKALVENQTVGGKFLHQASVDHVDSGNDPDGNKALANILKLQTKNLENLKSLSFEFNKSKIYTATLGTLGIKNRIDILTLDIPFQCDLLHYLEGFPISKSLNRNSRRVKCVICGDKFVRKDYCCDSCKSCKACNEQLPNNQQCPVIHLWIAFEKNRLLRNLFSHLTFAELESFLEGQHTFEDFPNVTNWDELCKVFLEIQSIICDYLCDGKNFSNPNVVLMTPAERQSHLDKLGDILNRDVNVECDMNLLTNLKGMVLSELKSSNDRNMQMIAVLENNLRKEIQASKGNIR